MRTVVALAVGAFVAVGTLLATAAPASAHTISVDPPTNYQSILLGVVPATPGISVRVRELGTLVEVTNHTGQDLIVLGYQEEPYLRVGPGGTFENVNSPTLYQNKVTVVGVTAAVPPNATAEAAPQWRHTGSGNILRWRDQRTRHEGPTPQPVTADPHVAHVVSQWTIPMQLGGDQVVADGLVRWNPPPNPWPWLALAGALLVAVVAAGSTRHWSVVLVAALAALVGVDVVRAVAAATPAATSLASAAVILLAASWYDVAAWVAAAVAIFQLERGDDAGLFLVAFAGGCLLLFGGIDNIGVLTHAEIASALQPAIARLAAAVCIGLGGAVLIGSVVWVRRFNKKGASVT